MNEAAIREKLYELSQTVQAMPLIGQGKVPTEGVYQPHSPIWKLSIEDALDYLRLHVKYLVFDLEATRRENRYLRQMLEMRPRPDREDGDDAASGK